MTLKSALRSDHSIGKGPTRWERLHNGTVSWLESKNSTQIWRKIKFLTVNSQSMVTNNSKDVVVVVNLKGRCQL